MDSIDVDSIDAGLPEAVESYVDHSFEAVPDITGWMVSEDPTGPINAYTVVNWEIPEDSILFDLI